MVLGQLSIAFAAEKPFQKVYKLKAASRGAWNTLAGLNPAKGCSHGEG
jgi:hypothetical protein